VHWHSIFERVNDLYIYMSLRCENERTRTRGVLRASS
jgi:hypothetical protein